jgi:fatty-acyl-CoA synthase
MVGDVMGRPLAEELAARSAAYDTTSLATVITSGAPLSAAVRGELMVQLPHLRIINRLGSSESGAIGVASAVGRGAGPSGTGGFSVSQDTAVLDDELRPLAPGDHRSGRLARRGFIPLGYHKDPVKTEATFVVDEQGIRWVLPGDSATVLPDGQINLLGRGSATINSGGEKIFPQEVEAALKSHSAVFDAIVVGIPDERYGQAVAAVIQPRLGASPTLDELGDHCRLQIAGYKVPKRILLVEEIPLTAMSKPDHLAARSMLAEGQPLSADEFRGPASIRQLPE